MRTSLLVTLVLLLTVCAGCESSAYFAMVDDARGLKPGAPVYVAGVEVGTVNSTTLQGQKARVNLILPTELTLKEDACAAVETYGLAGDAHAVLELGTEGRASLAGGEIMMCNRGGSRHADEAMESVASILSQIEKGEGTVGRLIRDPVLASKLEDFLTNRCPPPAQTSAPAVAPAPNATSSAPPSRKPFDAFQ